MISRLSPHWVTVVEYVTLGSFGSGNSPWSVLKVSGGNRFPPEAVCGRQEFVFFFVAFIRFSNQLTICRQFLEASKQNCPAIESFRKHNKSTCWPDIFHWSHSTLGIKKTPVILIGIMPVEIGNASLPRRRASQSKLNNSILIAIVKQRPVHTCIQSAGRGVGHGGHLRFVKQPKIA